MNLEQIRARQAELQAQMTTMKAEAESAEDGKGRQFTETECATIMASSEEFDGLAAQALALEALARASATAAQSAGRRTSPGPVPVQTPATQVQPAATQPAATSITGGYPAGAPSPLQHGFPRICDFALAVRAASANGGIVDDRLRYHAGAIGLPGQESGARMAPTTVTETGVGADGGFAVPPDFRPEIMRLISGDEALLPRTRQWQTESNSVKIPVDRNAPHSSSGLQAVWLAENQQMTQSNVNLGQNEIVLHKLGILAPVTDEMLSDAALLQSYLTGMDGVGAVLTEGINDAIIDGNGVGKPLGLIASGATISVAKETSQVAATLLAQNISKMWARFYAPSRMSGVWLINQDVEPQLDNLFLAITNVAGSENVGGIPVYLPANGLSGAGFATLKGRPVIPQQSCETLGSVGDIILADLSRYWTAVKTDGGMRQDVSMHLWFDYDTAAFRFIFRIGGLPAWSGAMSPKKGSNTLSTQITLAVRA